jgi:hypothetical protein
MAGNPEKLRVAGRFAEKSRTDQQTKALEFFKDWTNYLLVTSVAALGWTAKEIRPTAVADGAAILKPLSAVCLAISIMFAILTLALIPLVQEQRKEAQSNYDVRAEYWLLGRLRQHKLKDACFWQHLFFLFAVALYAIDVALPLGQSLWSSVATLVIKK